MNYSEDGCGGSFSFDPDESYETEYREYSFSLPETYNLGVDIYEANPDSGIAAVQVEDSGGTEEYSFGYLDEKSDSLADSISGLGFERGDRVAVCLDEGPESIVVHTALLKAGLVSAPVSRMLGRRAIETRLRDMDARYVFTGVGKLEDFGKIYGELESLEGIGLVERGQDGDVQEVADRHSDGNEDPVVPDGVDSYTDGVDSYNEMVSSGDPEQFSAADSSGDDPAFVFYNSGTTGEPKGVFKPHRVVPGRLPGFALAQSFPDRGNRFYSPVEWAWIGGLLDSVLAPLLLGLTLVVKRRGKFDPVDTLSFLENQRVTNGFLPPTALRSIKETGTEGFELELEGVHAAGEKVSDELKSWARDELDVRLNEVYGQSEAGFVVGESVMIERRPGATGKPYPGHEVDIVDGEGEVLEDGEVGEIAVDKSSPVVMTKYLGRPEKTSDAFVDGWLLTGDLGYRDEDGYIYYECRKDDLIISSGYRISAPEVEEEIDRHPDVLESAVVGEPDHMRGELVKAYVVTDGELSDVGSSKESVKNQVKENLAAYEYPRRVEILESLPRTVTGKIDKSELS
ncbi:MAG: AMP-binding protein [Halobacteria archaeon]